MLGTLVNVVAVIVGGSIGLLLRKGLSEKMADTLMNGLGLCTLYLGISGSLRGENSLILILSMVVDTILAKPAPSADPLAGDEGPPETPPEESL